MDELLRKIADCIEFGKVNLASPYPPAMKGQDGADELTKKAVEAGIKPEKILNDALVVGMEKVGQKFAEKKIFIPQMLMAAKAMNAAIEHLKPFFLSGEVKRKGKLIIGTVSGDLHDIGKNLVGLMIGGNGWEIIDLGVDVKTEQFIEAIKKYEGAVLGMSALLTTTMANMGTSVKTIKELYPNQKIIIGGAPLSEEFRKEVGADFYSSDPQGAVKYLSSLIS
jgi:methanogenic corrinoid protein MtbC1